MVSQQRRRPGHTVAVFGSSEPQPGDPVYENARLVGTLLARAGCAVLNGGYGGVMEASGRGAREAGGHVIGVTVETFSGRTPNPYLVEEHREPNLYSRCRRLIEEGDAFIILPGRSGTLSELTLLWALLRAGQMPEKPIALMGEEWPPLLDTLRRLDFLEPRLLDVTRCTPSPEEAVAWALSKTPSTT
jgi:uncharacterized protein (TIGR00730 family)